MNPPGQASGLAIPAARSAEAGPPGISPLARTAGVPSPEPVASPEPGAWHGPEGRPRDPGPQLARRARPPSKSRRPTAPPPRGGSSSPGSRASRGSRGRFYHPTSRGGASILRVQTGRGDPKWLIQLAFTAARHTRQHRPSVRTRAHRSDRPAAPARRRSTPQARDHLSLHRHHHRRAGLRQEPRRRDHPRAEAVFPRGSPIPRLRGSRTLPKKVSSICCSGRLRFTSSTPGCCSPWHRSCSSPGPWLTLVRGRSCWLPRWPSP